jgi:hypothetical protein
MTDISAKSLPLRRVDPNVPSGAVSIANCLILWGFKNHELRSKGAIFSVR